MDPVTVAAAAKLFDSGMKALAGGPSSAFASSNDQIDHSGWMVSTGSGTVGGDGKFAYWLIGAAALLGLVWLKLR